MRSPIIRFIVRPAIACLWVAFLCLPRAESAGAEPGPAGDAAVAEPAAAGGLSLDDVKRMALRDNPDLAAAEARIDAAMAALREAQAAYYPTVSVFGGARHDESIPASADVGDDSRQVYSVGGSATYLLFDGFARKFRTMARKAGEEASRESFRDVERILLQAVSAAYYDSLLALEAVKIAEQDAAFNDELSEETRKRFNAGAAARSDVLNFEIRKTRAESLRLGAERSYRTARVVLARLMGVPDAVPARELAPISISDGEELPAVPDPVAELDYALAHRPDYLFSGHLVEQIRLDLKAAKGDYYPVIGAEAEVSWNRESNPRFSYEDDRSASVGIGATWELFSGGRTRATCARLEARARELGEERRAVRIGIHAEIRSQIDTVTVAREQVGLERRVFDMTSEARRLVRNEYLAGRASLTRLNEAQTDLVRASGELALATLRFYRSLQDLSAASGRISEIAAE